MDKEIIFLVEESPEGGYEARALGHSIFTEADTYEDLKKMVQDAVGCHFEPEQRPRVVRLHLVREEILALRGCLGMWEGKSWPDSWQRTAMMSPDRQVAISA